jgi:hypothetical protein
LVELIFAERQHHDVAGRGGFAAVYAETQKSVNESVDFN